MPELPEVNTFKRFFEETSLQQKIIAVHTYDGKIIRNIDPDGFREKLAGRLFVDSVRIGKYLFSRMDNGHYVQFHFGMTGDFAYYSGREESPKHERLAFDFQNGFSLGFDCPRKFARICYIEDLDIYLTKLGLGEDALTISQEQFLAKAQGKKSTIKGFLLNQKHIAGVGNLYADEVLYQTRIHPASVVEAIPKHKMVDVYHKMKSILEYAVSQNAYYKAYPDDWLWGWRKEGAKAPDGSVVDIQKIGGRTTYFFPEYQQYFT